MALDAKTEVMQQVRQQAALQNARFLVDVSCTCSRCHHINLVEGKYQCA